MRNLTHIFLILLSLHIVKAQEFHEWETITYMNNITDVEYIQGDIWVSTTGGAYRFNLSDSSSTNFTNIDGLASLNLTCIANDHENNVFFGSENGVICVYNISANTWKSYFSMEGEKLTDIYVNDDSVWVASINGLGIFLRRDSFLEYREFYSNFPIEPNTSHRVVVFKNQVFLATENGLLYAPSDFIKHNLLIESAWQTISTDNGLPADEILDMIIHDDSLYVATTAGVIKLDSNLNINQVSGWTLGYVNKMIVSDQKKYFIRNTDYYEQIGNQWILLNTFDKTISSVTPDEYGELWFGLQNGGIRKNGWDKSFLIDGPASNHVGKLIMDQMGNLWITSGTHHLPQGQGFYKYDFNTWSNYKFYDNNWNRINGTVNVYEDNSGNIWLGTWGGGMVLLSNTEDDLIFYHGWQGEGRVVISTAQGEEEIFLPEVPTERQDCVAGAEVNATYYTVITNFLEDESGNLWFANYLADRPEYIGIIPSDDNGKVITDCSEWTFLGNEINMSLTEGEIGPMEFDDYGRLWLGTFREGLLVLDFNKTVNNKSDDNLIRTTTADNLFSNMVLSLKKDHDGIMWIGTDGGLNSWDGSNSFYKHLGEDGKLGPVENKINHIFVDKFNNKWYSTDGGLTILKSNKSPWDENAWVHFTPENSGLPSKIVNCIYVDDKTGAAYIGTENGLSIYNGSYAEFKSDLNSLNGGPNPFILVSGSKYTIKNLVPDVKIKILDINGSVIRTLSDEDGSIHGSRANWNGRDEKNRLVSSGIYLYLVYNEEGLTGKGKISVIR